MEDCVRDQFNFTEPLPKHLNDKYIDRGMVQQFAGYLSVCWDKDSTFESEKATIAVDNLISYIAAGFPEINED